MIKGTRILEGKDAAKYRSVVNTLREILIKEGFEEVIFPILWEQQTFTDKAGPEILNQMYDFQDKKGRDICLIPEVTALVEETWNKHWSKSKKSPYCIFYESRCYRYERPQSGRYREFYQFGVEILGGDTSATDKMIENIMYKLLNSFDIDYTVSSSVKRGLDYYTQNGFEVECAKLGAQKQILGGGRYTSGVGFAIGIDRLILASNS